MGVVIRLKNVNIGASPLGVIKQGFLSQGTMTLVPSVDGVVSRLPTGINLTSVGTPVVTAQYMQGNGTINYLKTNYVRDSTKDFTLAVVLRRDAVDGTQFYAGDYHNASDINNPINTGMGIISTGATGIRPVVHLTAGAAFSTEDMPTALSTGVQLQEWYFACLTVNASARTGTLYVPALGVAWTSTWEAAMRPLEPTEYISFLGNSSGASGGAAKLALASFYERAFTQAEVTQQHTLAKDFCASKGLTIN